MARRSDHSREEIQRLALDAAEKLLDEGGSKALTARRVASEIGYTVGTLYLVFENLDDLVLQVNGRTLDQLNAWLTERRGEQRTGQAALEELATAYIDFAETHSSRWNLLFEYVQAQGNELPAWYVAKISDIFELIETALPITPASTSQRDRVRLSRILWASVHGICILRIRQRLDLAGGQATEEMTHALIRFFLQGMEQTGQDDQR